MSSTIDNINFNILNKINYLLTATKILLDYTLEDVDYNRVISIKNILEELLQTYELGSIKLLKEYQSITKQDSPQVSHQDSRQSTHAQKMQRVIDEPRLDNEESKQELEYPDVTESTSNGDFYQDFINKNSTTRVSSSKAVHTSLDENGNEIIDETIVTEDEIIDETIVTEECISNMESDDLYVQPYQSIQQHSNIAPPIFITRSYSPDMISKINKVYKAYAKFISSENINSILTRQYKYLASIQKIYNIVEIDLIDALTYFPIGDINMDVRELETPACACGNTFEIEAKTSEHKCTKCGNSEKIYGVVFEDEQFFYQEGHRTKHGKYDPTKHCKFWLDRIQAKENTDIPDKIIMAIKKCMRRDVVWLDLSCKLVRKYLKELKHTNYNDHAPLIKKIITGKDTASLTDHECKRVYIIFSRVVQIYNRIKPDNKPNCPYHPYFIYKIIEQLLKEPEHKRRRDEILQSIHLQSRDTLIDNDNIWKPICENLEDFTYIPTEST